jgi:hypothetical protein
MDENTLFGTIGDAAVFVERHHVLEGHFDAKPQFRIGRSFGNWVVGEPATIQGGVRSLNGHVNSTNSATTMNST